MMESGKVMKAVTPAEAGVQNDLNELDSRFRENDEKGTQRTFYEIINVWLAKENGLRYR
ncbi:MAG: hypothetical protein NTY64_02190 [Deltaproteobacteria bacterium]|nr:hypothetical protein [Deltaproteobacteria bacterium]